MPHYVASAVKATGNAAGFVVGAVATGVTLGQSQTTIEWTQDCRQATYDHTKAAVRGEPHVKAFREDLDRRTRTK